ncbi:hypothetical protein LX69_02200 [Breznakibacter xylanolyticus]|uniref:Uncharacterized protein n=1 Tax=Breznakibacter xylanolyticus TaxID=990 RepID=A0A2W7NVU6_9BACT|nr:hypothetical protein LX69_02200 [Breznakibacter xylanolyticus]
MFFHDKLSTLYFSDGDEGLMNQVASINGIHVSRKKKQAAINNYA